MSTIQVLQLDTANEIQQQLQAIGTGPYGIQNMTDKGLFKVIKLTGVPTPLAQILKMEMLAKGGEAAISSAGLHSAEAQTDVILMGTRAVLKSLSACLKRFPMTPLKEIGQQIKVVLNNWEQPVFSIPLPDGQSLALGANTLVMGIVNITPDSFSDGGQFLETEAAVARALACQNEGADIIDLGAASSRPGKEIDSPEEEWARLEPVLQALRHEKLIISVDTFRAEIAEKALQLGAHIINDIGRLEMDHDLAAVAGKYQAPVILMHNHMQLQPIQPYTDIMTNILEELSLSIDKALAAGLSRQHIIVDPGVGFGKNPVQNRLIIKRLAELKTLGLPILLGTSRKRFINDTILSAPQERMEASVATAVIGAMHGADIVRVHDVAATKKAIMMADAIRKENG